MNYKKIIICLIFIIITISEGCGNKQKEKNNLNDFEKLYLSRRPPYGEMYIIDLSGEPLERNILAASLQGVINKKLARIYLINGDEGSNRPWEKQNATESARFWAEYYQQKYGIEKAWEGNLDDAVEMFSSEVNGYILVSMDEPWTINAATTIAGLENSLIAFPNTQEFLESKGIKMHESLTGKWENASECYLYLQENYYSKMPHRGIAILNPEEYRLRDFLIQQGILTVYARPTTEEWETVQDILFNLPENLPLYGYLSNTGAEELVAVLALSQSGKFLIPTDTTQNLSFHVSVKPASSAPVSLPDETGLCSTDRLNVAIAISDGDNLVIPTNRYVWNNFWRSGLRGRIPLGWSFSFGLNFIAPAIADYFLSSTTANDELVGMLGIGYVYISNYPDKKFFLQNSFQIMKDIGLKTFWTLDPQLYSTGSRVWNDIDNNLIGDYPSGILMGYFSLFGPSYFRTPAGKPVLVPVNVYEDTPNTIAQKIREVLTLTLSERPPVVFISASAWSNPVDDLVNALEPLKNEGVNFLLPYQALKCVP
jgi:hypothetical protein